MIDYVPVKNNEPLINAIADPNIRIVSLLSQKAVTILMADQVY